MSLRSLLIGTAVAAAAALHAAPARAQFGTLYGGFYAGNGLYNNFGVGSLGTYTGPLVGPVTPFGFYSPLWSSRAFYPQLAGFAAANGPYTTVGALLDSGLLPDPSLPHRLPRPASKDSAPAPRTGNYHAFYSPAGERSAQGAFPAVAGGEAGDGAARLVVRAPEGAEIRFEGPAARGGVVELTRSGRELVSTHLTPGKEYTCEVRARWMEDGRIIDRVRTVHLRANTRTEIDMARPQPNDQTQDR
jgi:uncharacterized protein (TIGR03000 family)